MLIDIQVYRSVQNLLGNNYYYNCLGELLKARVERLVIVMREHDYV